MTTIPAFDGLSTCRSRPRTRTRTTYFVEFATTTANRYGHRDVLPYNSIAQASAVMCGGSRKTARAPGPPAYSAGRRSAQLSSRSSSNAEA